MPKLSELMITNPDVGSFARLEEVVQHCASSGATTLHFDLKPDYPDTPRNWEWRLEAAFYRGDRR